MEQSAPHASRKIYSVSELTQDIKKLLEERYSLIWISAEISNLRIPNSGHAYFSLKDERAQIAAVMFRGQLKQLRFMLENGMALLSLGRITVYEPRGNYQFIVEYAEPKGAGALQVAFEQLKKKLGEEGLFDEAHKIPLPFLPSRLGVITSSTGAALQDILKVIKKRYHGLGVDIYPVRVQGGSAAAEVSRAIELANQRQVNDVIIIARGGGSIEDLAPFNRESLARAIFASNIPIVSAIGHETDFTIADFVADYRAPTPSAAAESVVPVKLELKGRCAELRQRCWRAAVQHIERRRQTIAYLLRSLTHPKTRVAENRLKVDLLTERLVQSMDNLLNKRKSRLQFLVAATVRHNPMIDVRDCLSNLKMLQFRLQKSVDGLFHKYLERIRKAETLLAALNPQAILERGYSITRLLPGRQVATKAASIRPGQRLDIQLAHGSVQALAQPSTDEK